MNIRPDEKRSYSIFIFAFLSCLFIYVGDNVVAKVRDKGSQGGRGVHDRNELTRELLPWQRSIHASLDKPILIAPECRITTRRPLYQWHPVERADRYGIIVFQAKERPVPVFIKLNIKEMEIRQPWFRRLRYDTDYFFVVIAYSNKRKREVSPFSERMYFSVARNIAPVADDLEVVMNEDEETDIILTASDTDGDSLDYDVMTIPNHGSLVGEAPEITYTPYENYYGNDGFTYKANDGLEDSNTATVTIFINPVNDPPFAGDDEVTIVANGLGVIPFSTLLANDTDIDEDTLTISGYTQPLNGSVVDNVDNTFSYTQDKNHIGDDVFSYTVSDTNWSTDSANVVIIVDYSVPPVTITADPGIINSGGSSSISWSTAYATNVTIDQGIGTVDSSGSISVTPTETTTYTITAEGPGGTATDSVTIIVLIAPADADLGIDEDEQQGGGGLVGETVRILNGNTIETRSDLQFPSPNHLGLVLVAFYNSRSDIIGSMGHGWSHTYEVSLDHAIDIESVAFVKILDNTGRGHYFMEGSAGEYSGAFGEKSHVVLDAGEEYIWYRLDGSRYGFSDTGQLLWIDDATGNRLQVAYDSSDRVKLVTDIASARVLTFNYNSYGLIDSVTGPVTSAVDDGIWVMYGYDSNRNLTSVTYADNTGFDYSYSDSNDIHNLTEKKDKAGHLINTWGYDDSDRAVSNFSRDGKGVDIEYSSNTQVDVIDAYGKEREYLLDDVSGRKRVSAIINGPGGAGAFPWTEDKTVSWIYDEDMNLLEVESAGGIISQYLDYDDRRNPGILTLALGTSVERTITYTYHPGMNTPLTRTETSVLGSGVKETVWDYDDDYDSIPNEAPTALLSRIVEKGYTKDRLGTVITYEYISTFTYNSKGQILSIDGPLTGTCDATVFAYDTSTGDLLSITRPLIGATTFSDYDAAGQIGSVTDVNGYVKSFAYDGRGRVTVITNNADSSTSTVDYNSAGLPDLKTDEDGVTSSFEYDAIYGRLIYRYDHEGNYIAYVYDDQGNLIEKGYYDSADTRTNRKRFLYQDTVHDMPGLLFKEINADDTYAQYGYDLEGNVVSVTDPNGNTTTYVYDDQNRLETVAQPGSVVTSYGYDIHGNIASVTDAEGHTTVYQYDDMGRLVSTTSSDTGTVTYVYDKAGNPINKTDAMGITVEYEYDTLNRLTNVHFPDLSQDITYSYDAGTNGIGQRTGMEDKSGDYIFSYDSRGRLTGKTSVIDGIIYNISRTYTAGGRVSFITYPTGRTIDYNRTSCACNVDSITTTYEGTTYTLIENIAYRPFGGANAMDIGAGGIVGSEYDESGKLITSNPGAEHERRYTYDNNGNLVSVNAPSTPWYNRMYEYDSLNRLTHAEGPWGQTDYTYDDVGNRLMKIENTDTETYTYVTDTNILEEVVTDTDTVSYTFDMNGNIRSIGDKTFIYNQNNRLVLVEKGGAILGEYTYNGLEQRIIKEADGQTTVFHYDFDGNIIGESDSTGNFDKEYLYRSSSRLALVDVTGSELYYYGNDQLGTPQILTDSTNTVVWEADYSPFGEAMVNPNSSVVNNFRLPGQYYDSETELHYNYHRYYEPATGRYLRADPIRLEGRMNLFLYAENNPVNSFDPLGLDTWSGAGVEVGGFLAFGGTSTLRGFVTNWDTGERCNIEVVCYKLGLGLGGGITAQSIWILGGPKCGKQLAGVSVGGGTEGGLGGYVSGAPGGAVGASKNVAGGHSTGITGGAGIGAGGAMYGYHCTTRVISCENTPCACVK